MEAELKLVEEQAAMEDRPTAALLDSIGQGEFLKDVDKEFIKAKNDILQNGAKSYEITLKIKLKAPAKDSPLMEINGDVNGRATFDRARKTSAFVNADGSVTLTTNKKLG